MNELDRIKAEQSKLWALQTDSIPDWLVLMGWADWMIEEHMLNLQQDTYRQFLSSKRIVSKSCGMTEPYPVRECLMDFQRDIVRWALKRGRAAIWAGTGLGKTLMQLEWADQIHRMLTVQRTEPSRILLLCPLAVAEQTAHEAKKFGIPGAEVRRGSSDLCPITITNYEMLWHFNPSDFGAIVLDESSILKAFDGATRKQITYFCGTIPYRLSCTATPAPNDYVEIGTQCEFLGVMSRTEMLATFFVHDGGETSVWRLKRHAVEKFWEFVASWAVLITKPSDLGYEDHNFRLKPIHYHPITVESKALPGMLFPAEAKTLTERRDARRESLYERVKACADIVNASEEQWVVWCDLNAESEQITKSIPGAVEVRGSDTPKHKVDSSEGFKSGSIRVLVSKPSIYGWGLNWQHCRNVAFVGLSDSFEAMYQAVRRCWRFGQSREVNVYVITSTAEGAVVRNIESKEKRYAEMVAGMVKHMKDINEKEVHGAERKEEKYECMVTRGEADQWTAYLGDSCDVLPSIPSNSVHFSVYSPPFASLYTYTNSERDMGNCKTHSEFFDHYRFMVKELYRVLIPGRLLSFHCMNLPTSKERDGYIGITDFRGDLIRIHQECGFIYHSEVVIWKDPVTAMQRTKALGLLHKQIKKDSCMSRQGIPDFLVTMRKPGANQEPVAGRFERYVGDDGTEPGSTCRTCSGTGQWTDEYGDRYACACVSVDRDDRFSIEVWQRYASPVWMDINPSDTLQRKSAREHDDERHIAPLQLQVIERAIELWTNPGDLVLSPFMGIGSEGYVAGRTGRKFIGIELKRSYYDQAVKNLDQAYSKATQQSMLAFE